MLMKNNLQTKERLRNPAQPSDGADMAFGHAAHRQSLGEAGVQEIVSREIGSRAEVDSRNLE